MTSSDNHSSRSRLLQGLGLLLLSVIVVGGLGWAAGRQAQTPTLATGGPGLTSASPAEPALAERASLDGTAMLAALGAEAPDGGLAPNEGGYPPPASPSPTPPPDAGGLFPPPSIEHQIVTRGGSPYGDLISAIELALAGSEGGAFSPWVDDLGAGLGLDYPGATEGLGIRMAPSDAADLVDQLFATGAAPVVQGYFEEAGCDHSLPESPPCAAVIVVTGLGGPVPMPTKHPAETLGPAAPLEMPLQAAAWSIYPDSTGPYWTDWWLGNGYYELLERLVQEGHGTYFVLR